MSITICIGSWCCGKTTHVKALEAEYTSSDYGYLYEEQNIPNQLLCKYGTTIRPNCSHDWLCMRTQDANDLWTSMFERQMAAVKYRSHIMLDYHPLSGTYYMLAIEAYRKRITYEEAAEELLYLTEGYMETITDRRVLYYLPGNPIENKREREYDLDGRWLQDALTELSNHLVWSPDILLI